jgi:hypothetical protein
MEDEDQDLPPASVIWPLRYGLALPYIRGLSYPDVDIDVGLRAGFLLTDKISATRAEDDEEIQVLARAACTNIRAIEQEEEDLRDVVAIGK